MTYCVNPNCQRPQNPDTNKFCSSCGSALYLRQRYRPVAKLGQGGFGKTFIAIDEDIPSLPPCVVKQLYIKGFDPETTQKAKRLFRQEAVQLDQLGKHDQIPELWASFEQDEQLYLVQEFVDGLTLSQEVQQYGNYSAEEVEKLLRELLPVLQFVHDHKVIHRDIKPQNMIRRKGDRLPVLIDFGVAKWVSDTMLNKTGTVVGSAEYMPLEQLRGKVFPASDLYSLGVTCIHLLTGLPPLDLYDIVSDRWVWRDYLLPENRISLSLGQILDRLLARNMSERFQSASEVLSVLSVTPSVSAVKSMAPPTAKTPPVPPQKGQNKPANPIHTVKTWVFGAGGINAVPLTSGAGIDYHLLQDLLQAKRWQAADEETWKCLHAAVNPLSRFLSPRDLAQVPSEDWCTMDRLWIEGSEGQFGFSIQVRLYQQVGEDYLRFCQSVKWPLRQALHWEKQLQYKLHSPVGHLPSPLRFKGSDLSKYIEAIASRCIACGLLS